MPSTTVAPTRRAHAVPTHPSVRHHRSQVARWALAHGHHVDRDALAAIVAVRADATVGTVDLRWTEHEVGRVIWHSVPTWCSTHGVRAPADVTATLTTYLRFLSTQRRLAPGSESITVLRRAVADHRPSSQRSRARHPAAGRPAPVLPIC
jgi:hypothetical protein